MTKRRVTATAFLFLALVACGGAAEPNDPAPSTPVPGNTSGSPPSTPAPGDTNCPDCGQCGLVGGPTAPDWLTDGGYGTFEGKPVIVLQIKKRNPQTCADSVAAASLLVYADRKTTLVPFDPKTSTIDTSARDKDLAFIRWTDRDLRATVKRQEDKSLLYTFSDTNGTLATATCTKSGEAIVCATP